MNRMDTLSRPSATKKLDSLPRRFARLVLTGPGQLASPLSRWAVTLLAVAGAALLVWSAVIHLQLWSDGYRDISVIGPLFLLQGIASIALALPLVVFRRLVLLAAGAILLAGTAAGLLLSAGIGLPGPVEPRPPGPSAGSLSSQDPGKHDLHTAGPTLPIRGQPRVNH